MNAAQCRAAIEKRFLDIEISFLGGLGFYWIETDDFAVAHPVVKQNADLRDFLF